MGGRRIFYLVSFSTLLLIAIVNFYWQPAIWALMIWLPLFVLGIHDMYFTTHNVLRIYPVLGHLRYMFEFIRPEIQQYFIATNQSGRPFNREQRDMVYARSQNELDTLPFGTQQDIHKEGYELAHHSLRPCEIDPKCARVELAGPQCKQPYSASRLNVSAMSFGALSKNAIMALNQGAKLGNFAHNTGEGGLTDYHLSGGGDIFWQIGTGYFGCRTKDGKFDPAQFKDRSNLPQVKMVELKLSQGAKPSHGGILPAAKVDEEIARYRGVEVGKDCISPPAHSAFSTPLEMMQFIAKLRELCGAKPVGFKLCIGIHHEFMAICKAMLETGIYPDFITIDGAEGGTGAAPLEFSNRLGVPLEQALIFVNNCLVGAGLRDKIKLIASGKIISGFDMMTKIALGANMCNSARGMMFALGCIQAVRCNTNTCPSGVATQDAERVKALDVARKHIRVANFHQNTIKSFFEMIGAMGIADPDMLTPSHIIKRMSDETGKTYAELYPFLEPGELLSGDIRDAFYARDWHKANAANF